MLRDLQGMKYAFPLGGKVSDILASSYYHLIPPELKRDLGTTLRMCLRTRDGGIGWVGDDILQVRGIFMAGACQRDSQHTRPRGAHA